MIECKAKSNKHLISIKFSPFSRSKKAIDITYKAHQMGVKAGLRLQTVLF